MYISRITLSGIRAFTPNLDINVSNTDGRPRMKTGIIGKNGTNKTTLLRCIAIGLCDRDSANALLAEPIGNLVSKGRSKATISIELVPNKNSKKSIKVTTFLKKSGARDVVWRQDRPKSWSNRRRLNLVCGYGAGRSSEGPDAGAPYQIVDSVYSLFNYDQTMMSAELLLRRLEDYLGSKIYDSTMLGIKRVLGLSSDHEIKFMRGGGVSISGPSVGPNIRLEEWADGYRKTFSWILDMYGWAMRNNSVLDSGGIDGILLIDEIEQHIHPSMQLNLINFLSEFCPSLQIFTTTHSPLIALGLEPDELCVLQRKKHRVTLEPDVPNFLSYSADDMLFDKRTFGSAIERDDQLEDKKRYEELIRKPKNKRGKSESLEISKLVKKRLLAEKPTNSTSDLMIELDAIRHKFDL